MALTTASGGEDPGHRDTWEMSRCRDPWVAGAGAEGGEGPGPEGRLPGHRRAETLSSSWVALHCKLTARDRVEDILGLRNNKSKFALVFVTHLGGRSKAQVLPHSWRAARLPRGPCTPASALLHTGALGAGRHGPRR